MLFLATENFSVFIIKDKKKIKICQFLESNKKQACFCVITSVESQRNESLRTLKFTY